MRVLLTGAAGRIGQTLRRGFAGKYALLRLLDLAPIADLRPGEEFFRTDIGDIAGLETAMAGIDCVVHLAGIPDEDSWDIILQANIIGTYNVFEAARRCGVKRLVYASSIHTIGFYRNGETIDELVPVRPDSRYGVSKVFGEALGRLYADKHGMSVACLRICSFRPEPQNRRELSTWISPGDTVDLVARCIDEPDYHFIVIYGASANARRQWMDRGSAAVGFSPKDDAERFAPLVEHLPAPGGEVSALFHGGPTCAREFDGILSKIDGR